MIYVGHKEPLRIPPDHPMAPVRLALQSRIDQNVLLQSQALLSGEHAVIPRLLEALERDSETIRKLDQSFRDEVGEMDPARVVDLTFDDHFNPVVKGWTPPLAN